MSEKIKPHHLGRKAVLYVRQSSAHQVAHNQESRQLQYAMKKRLEQLGFQEIEIIDEDLGRSAAGAVQRSGFDRMVADVCLPPPTDEEIEALALKIAHRLTAVVERRCDDAFETDALLEQTAAALQQALAVAVKAPVPHAQLGLAGQEDPPPVDDRQEA